MLMKIKRKDGSILELHDGTVRLQVKVQLFGKAEVFDPRDSTTFQVEQLADRSFAEVVPSSAD